MRLHWEAHELWVRQSSNLTTYNPPAKSSGMPVATKGAIIAAAVVGALFLVSTLTFLFLRGIRVRYSNPKYIPSQFLKSRWRSWSPTRFKYLPSLQRHESGQEMQVSDRNIASRVTGSRRARTAAERESMVDRHTSVRSVITLPPYSADVRENEEVLGREGEREGIDTVVEFPETEMETEERREEEMQALFEIRQVRRNERSARAERRRRRQDAIARNDTTELENLRRERRERLAAQTPTSQALIAEHEARERRGRLGEVEYAQVGLARPDGSRVRANSNESVRPLLGSAASLGSNQRSNNRSPYAQHQASISTSSLRWAMTPDISDDEGDAGLSTTLSGGTRTRSRGDSTSEFSVRSRPWPLGNDFSASRLTLATTRTQGTLETVESASRASLEGEHEEGTASRGTSSGDAPPPEYEEINLNSPNARGRLAALRTDVPSEDAPPYSSPTQPVPGIHRSPSSTQSSPASTVDEMYTPHSRPHSTIDADGNNASISVPSIQITPHTPVVGSRPGSADPQL